jgi:acyl carrier protein
MIPHYFIELAQIPLTTNSKIDRNALPLPKLTRSKVETVYVAPHTGMEKTVAQSWQEVLHLDRVGIDDNFFDLGGNSLNIIEVNTKLQKLVGSDIPVVTLFTYTTVQSLARHLEESQVPRGEEGTVPGKGKNRTQAVNEGKNILKQSIQRKQERK